MPGADRLQSRDAAEAADVNGRCRAEGVSPCLVAPLLA